MAHRNQFRSESKVALAVEYLKLAQRDLNRAKSARIHYAHLGRSFGMTNAEVGAAVGITEAAVRTLLQRHPEAAA